MTDTETVAAVPAAPPVAERRPVSASWHGRTLTDDYGWLRDPGYPEVKDAEVLAHLEAENRWFEAWMAPRRGLVDTLFAELKGRIKEDDKSVPVREGDWLYWREFAVGAQYRTWWRRPADAPDGVGHQCILDEPALAQGHDYFRLGAFAVSLARGHFRLSTFTDTGDTLRHLVSSCHGDHRPDCPIIEGLASEGELQ